MSSPWKKKQQPEAVAEKVLKRAEVSKMARKLQNRLALAHFKSQNGWEDLTLDTIEPKVEEELRRRRPESSGDMLSDSSSSTISDFHYPRTLLSSSPIKGGPLFSDAIGSGSSSGGHRKRTYNNVLNLPDSSSSARKRFRSSPAAGLSLHSSHMAWKDRHHLPQSSPIKPRKPNTFTTSAAQSLNFFYGPNVMDEPGSPNFAAVSDDDDNLLPMHSFKMPSNDLRSSPPRTPPPMRGRAALGRQSNSKKNNGKSEEGADLLLYLATSPSPANPAIKARMHPPSTPPPRNPALPSSMMVTPGGGSGLMSGFGNPVTPSQHFDFADFVNITPSPAQATWNRTPGTIKTPQTVARRRLTFENYLPPGSPLHGSGTKHTGLGMQLGGNLLS